MSAPHAAEATSHLGAKPSGALSRVCENIDHTALKPPLSKAEAIKKYHENLRKYRPPTGSTPRKEPTVAVTPPYGRPKSTCNATVENAAEVSQLNATKLTADDLSLVSERLYTGKTCASGGLCSRVRSGSVGSSERREQPHVLRPLIRRASTCSHKAKKDDEPDVPQA